MLNMRKGIYFRPDGAGGGGGSDAGSGSGSGDGQGNTQGNGNPPEDGNPQEDGGQTPKTVPYERFAEVNKRANEMATRLSDLEKKQKDAEEAQLKEQNKWKELAEKRETELQTERLARLKLDVALKAGLPAEFAGRLQGETEEELEKDAKMLLPLVKPSTPGNPPAGSRQTPTTFTAEQLKDPAFVRKNKEQILAAAANESGK